jgi:putative DNA primase/helicase
MIEDFPDIPDFLRASPESDAAERQYWKGRKLTQQGSAFKAAPKREEEASGAAETNIQADPRDAGRFGNRAAELIRDARRSVALAAGQAAKVAAFRQSAEDLTKAFADQWLTKGRVVEVLTDIATAHDYFGTRVGEVEIIISGAIEAAATAKIVNLPRTEANALRAESVVLRMAADVPLEPVLWLWPHFIARGKMHLLGGAPASGKTTLAIAIGAVVSNGGRFPDGSRASVGNVVIWSGEDGISDTLVPRLKAVGTDLSRVHFVECVRDVAGSRPFDPARDMSKLETALEQTGNVALLIIDPVVSAVSGDSHKSNDVRRALQPLVDMISRRNIAAIGITHFSKGTAGRDPTERITGSIAFGALARVVLVAAKEESGPHEQEDNPTDRRIFSRAKSNIGPDGGGFSYRIETVDLAEGIVTTRVAWGEQLRGSAKEILGDAETNQAIDGEKGALSEACDLLRAELEDGPMPVKQLERKAADAGVTRATLRRAYKRAGVVKERIGFGPGATWVARLMPAEDHRCSSNPIGAHTLEDERL